MRMEVCGWTESVFKGVDVVDVHELVSGTEKKPQIGIFLLRNRWLVRDCLS